MTQICVTLTDETTAGVVERMAALETVADLFEVRGDLMRDLDLLAILRARSKPLVFACRPVSQGGRWPDADADGRRRQLLEAAKRGFDYVDVELESPLHDVVRERAGRGLIVSHHDLGGTPEDLEGIYRRAAQQGANFVKIAVQPSSFEDVGRLLGFAARTAAGEGPPLVPIALGPLGAITRVTAGRFGAPLSYAASAPGREAAPGQIPAADLADLYRVRKVGPGTLVFGILGAEVSQSLSPALHNRAFAARDVDAVYVPLPSPELAPFLAALPQLGLAGFSVTRPFKTEIVERLHAVDETAALCGSVNTVVVQDGQLHGSTSDGLGVAVPLRKRLELKGRTAVIVGAGGAARSAALALLRRGMQVHVLARDPDKAAFVAAAVGCAGGGLEELGGIAWDVLVNATPVGSGALEDASPVPAELLRPGAVVLDMVYVPLETRLLREAAAAGCTVIDGVEMLMAQAAAQFETWTRMEAPLEVMKSVALLLAQVGAEA